MSITDALAGRKYQDARTATWGHLAPVVGQTYSGVVIVAVDFNHSATLIDYAFKSEDGKALPASPWLFDIVDNITCDVEQTKPGMYQIAVVFQLRDNKPIKMRVSKPNCVASVAALLKKCGH